MQRRAFVKSLVVSATGISLIPDFFCIPKKNALGAQLWTIRDALQKDLTGSLRKLSELGYNKIELFGYNGTFWGKSPKEFSKICNDLGLSIISSHYDTGRHNHENGTLINGWDKAIEDAATINIKYMICAWLFPEERTSIDLYKSLGDMLNKAGGACRKSNIQFGYHNHDFEFPPINGIVPYDLILQSTDKELVKMEVDLYWITKADKDPVTYFKQYPNRFPLWHIKDMEKGTEQFTEVGNGVIDFDRIFAERKTAGLEHWFVEQDECRRDPFESLRISRDFVLKKKY